MVQSIKYVPENGGWQKMIKKYTLDRIEGEVAVCISREDGQVADFSAAPLLAAGVKEGGIFSAETDGKELFNVEYLAQETETAKEDARQRLLALFNRGKENKE